MLSADRNYGGLYPAGMFSALSPQLECGYKAGTIMSDESEALRESAKAIQEVAKASGKAIDAGREAGGWLGRVIGNPLEQAGSYIADRVKTKRIEAAIYDWGKLERCG
jgi:hypothetical protein